MILGAHENMGMEGTQYKQDSYLHRLSRARQTYDDIKMNHPVIEAKMGAPKKNEIDPYALFIESLVDSKLGKAADLKGSPLLRVSFIRVTFCF
jgi:hypothetical protein